MVTGGTGGLEGADRGCWLGPRWLLGWDRGGCWQIVVAGRPVAETEVERWLLGWDRGGCWQIVVAGRSWPRPRWEIEAETEVGSNGGDRDRGGHRRSRSRPPRADRALIKAEMVTASLGEPILVRDDHRRSLVIEVGTGESWRCRNPRQRTRKP